MLASMAALLIPRDQGVAPTGAKGSTLPGFRTPVAGRRLRADPEGCSMWLVVLLEAATRLCWGWSAGFAACGETPGGGLCRRRAGSESRFGFPGRAAAGGGG